VIFTLRCTVTF